MLRFPNVAPPLHCSTNAPFPTNTYNEGAITRRTISEGNIKKASED